MTEEVSETEETETSEQIDSEKPTNEQETIKSEDEFNKILQNIQEEIKAIDLRLKEYENLKLKKTFEGINEAYYNLWSSEANLHYRQVIRLKLRKKRFQERLKSTEDESNEVAS